MNSSDTTGGWLFVIICCISPIVWGAFCFLLGRKLHKIRAREAWNILRNKQL